MSIYGAWKDAVITIATDDDLTAEVSIEKDCDTLVVIIPTLTSSDLTLYAAEVSGGTYYAVGNTATIVAGTGEFIDVWEVGGLEHFKIGTSAGQAADRTFKVRGVRA
jgi:hypothetical protein